MSARKTIQWCMAHDGPEDWGGDCQTAAMEGHGAACEWGELRVAGPDDLLIRREDAEAVSALVDEQAEDEGLWFVAQTAPEAYLQFQLRRLHAVIEAATEGEDET